MMPSRLQDASAAHGADAMRGIYAMRHA